MSRIVSIQRMTAVAMIGCLLRASPGQAADALPDYTARPVPPGVITVYGSDLAGLVARWEADFSRLHPGVRFQSRFPSSDGWSAGMEASDADIGTSGREPVLTEYLSFNETFGYNPTEIAVATGAYDIKGKTWAEIIYVNKANPLSKLTMSQLDGIFGSERTGGYKGFKWMPEYARGADQNIRTWGQLGLKGKWADKPIHTYGYADTGMTNFFELKVFHGDDKWNPNYRQYVEYGTKMVSAGAIGQTGSIKYMLEHELANDPYGIGWTGIPHAADVPEVKAVAIAAKAGGPYVFPTLETVKNRTYPLTRSVYMFLNRPPGKPLRPQVKEFLRFVLSRQGQEDVTRLGSYLPLPAAFAREQRKKLD
jgi:phosphate transport system substrate-binding protein